MTVYRQPDRATYRYDFEFKRQRHSGSTGQVRKDRAESFEADLKRRLRERAGGFPASPEDTPRFQDWAETYYEQAKRHMTRPERVEILLRVALRFWGARPEKTRGKIRVVEGEPYHDLHLGDVVADPFWIVRFEDWLDARGSSGQTKNQYRSVVSQMFRLAASPAYRKRTGILANPFVGIVRDRSVERTTTVTVPELRAWLANASYHVRLAVAIAALAPKLRLSNILGLRWSEHLDPALTFITVSHHKTAQSTGRPLVVPVVPQLRVILENARRRNRREFVVSYRGRAIRGLRAGLAGAAERAGLHYGLRDGVTFHTIRHAMATLLAELGEPESMRKELLGHTRIETTQRYTHLRPLQQVGPLERLSAATPIADLVTHPRRRATRVAIEPVAPEAPRRDDLSGEGGETPT
jgi:integrase